MEGFSKSEIPELENFSMTGVITKQFPELKLQKLKELNISAGKIENFSSFASSDLPNLTHLNFNSVHAEG